MWFHAETENYLVLVGHVVSDRGQALKFTSLKNLNIPGIPYKFAVVPEGTLGTEFGNQGDSGKYFLWLIPMWWENKRLEVDYA